LANGKITCCLFIALKMQMGAFFQAYFYKKAVQLNRNPHSDPVLQKWGILFAILGKNDLQNTNPHLETYFRYSNINCIF